MPPVSCSHELHWLVPEHTSHSGVISPHLLINPADLLGFGLGQGGWMEEGEGFLCRCQGRHLNTRWQCHVAGEFCFIFSLDPVLGLILPSSVYLSRILGDAPKYLPPHHANVYLPAQIHSSGILLSPFLAGGILTHCSGLITPFRV